MSLRPSLRPSLRRLAVVLAAPIAGLSFALPASAASGSGGGGGGTGGGGTPAPTVGAIRAASAAAVCDAGTSMSVSVDKGFNKRVEMQLAYSGMAGGQWFTVRLVNDATGLSVNGFGSFPSSPSALITNLGGTVPVGPVELSFRSELHEGSFTGPILETCTAHLSTIAR